MCSVARLPGQTENIASKHYDSSFAGRYGLIVDVCLFSCHYYFIFCSHREIKDYSLMSRLHFRIHAAQQDLKERLKAGKFDLDDNDEVGGTQIIPSGNFCLLHGRSRLFSFVGYLTFSF